MPVKLSTTALLLTIVIIIVLHLTMIGKHLHLFKSKKRRQKRISPYLEIELWEGDELLCILKYESSKRNKAALALFWDLDARYHEITLLKIKHIRLKERYGEGEIPHEAKTGTGPILLTCSFP